MGDAGYILGLQAEYAPLPYVALFGAFKARISPGDVICIRSCPGPDEGWGLAAGVRLSSDWAFSWGFFVQGQAGFHSFTGRRVGARPSFGARTGFYVAPARWIELELDLDYQHVVGYDSAGVSFPAEDWGGIVLGVAVPVG